MRPSLRRSLILLTAVAVACTGPAAAAAAAAPGDLDPTFTPFGTRLGSAGGAESATHAIAQPDGKVLVATMNDDLGMTSTIQRLTADGQPDTGFSGGDAFTFPALSSDNVRITRLALTSTGKIAFAGVAYASGELLIGRLTADGDLDPSFNAAGPMPGTRRIALGGGAFATSVVSMSLDPSGRMSVVANGTNAGNEDVYVARFTDLGANDPTFDGGAVRVITAAGSQFAYQSDRTDSGAYVIVGYDAATDNSIAWRVAANGSAHATAVLDLRSGSFDSFTAVVAAGGESAMAAVQKDYATVLYRLDVSSGTPVVDGTFAPVMVFPFYYTYAMARQADGRLLLWSYSVSSPPNVTTFLTRTSANGVLDTTFGTGGTRAMGGLTTNQLVNDYFQLPSIAPDGRILIAYNVNAATSATPRVDRVVGNIGRVAASIASEPPTIVGTNTTTLTARGTFSGPDDAGAGTVKATVPAGLTIVSATGTGCTATTAGTEVTCAFASAPSGSTREVVIVVRGATLGSYAPSVAVDATTWDDDTADDTATTSLTYATAPVVVTPPPTTPPLRAVKLILRQLRGTRLVVCGATSLKPCAAPRIKRGVKTVPVVLRTQGTPVPSSTPRRATIAIQRLVGKRWIPAGSIRADLSAALGRKDVVLPATKRISPGLLRLRASVAAGPTTKAATSAYLYVKVA